MGGAEGQVRQGASGPKTVIRGLRRERQQGAYTACGCNLGTQVLTRDVVQRLVVWGNEAKREAGWTIYSENVSRIFLKGSSQLDRQNSAQSVCASSCEI